MASLLARRMRPLPLLALAVCAPLLAADHKPTLGWVEEIRLEPWDIVAKAKLDTGAKTSALSATAIERFERDGRAWVRFRLARDHANPDSATVLVEKPVEKRTKIKLRGTTKSADRPTVRLDFCLAGKRYNALFSLTDRSKFNYGVLLGRRFLAPVAIIDPGSTLQSEPACPSS
jgi:hypothetical protein